jgi:hypothetical protein
MPYNPTGHHPQHQMAMRNGLGTTALVLGIVGLVLTIIPLIGWVFGLILGLLGAIFGGIGLNRVAKKRADNKGVSIAGLVLSVIAVVASIATVAAMASAVSTAVGTGGIAVPAGGISPTIPPPGFQPSAPAVFEAGQGADFDGLVIVAGPLERVREQYLGTHVCTSVTYQNGSNDEINFNLFDWELKNPAGVIGRPTVTTDQALNSGALSAGGNVAGRVCFDDPGAAGSYELLYSPSFFGGRQITWRASL